AEAVGASSKLTAALLDSPESGRFYSPLVLNIARTEAIPMDELDRVPGTGKEGRVTKKDILNYVKLRKEGGSAPAQTSAPSTNGQHKTAAQATNGQAKAAQQQPAQQPAQQQTLAKPDPKIEETKTGVKFSPVASGGIQGVPQKTYTYNGGYEIQEMDRMRKMIADNMAYSKQVSPHVSSFVECDVTNLFNWRKRKKNAFMQKYGEKLTFTPIFVMAIAKAIREYPDINISVVGDKIIRKKDVNIGMAVAQPSGNLIVATIRNADELNLAGLTRRVNDLAKRARENKLSPDDVADATYTLSNVGTFGNIAGTPILMQPQVAILATGVIQKKPAVIETPEGDMIGIRQQMILSHSYDHRVVDGSLGGNFVFRVGQILENWDLEMEI
ncbi:MAG: dihydrolipoamide acetyltransferase family protein, partial [Bacteroidota bacterium]